MAKRVYIGINDVARKVKKMYVGVQNFTPRNLPSGYTQVEYIESNGAHLNTEFIPKNTTRVVANFAWLSGGAAVFGIRAGSGFIFYNEASQGNTYYTMFGGTYASTGVKASSGKKVVVDMNGAAGTVTIDGKAVSLATASFSLSYPLFLFAFNDSGGVNLNGSVRLYDSQIYDNGTMVRDYVTCVNASGTVGLYDMVYGKFYSSAGGGAFIAGPILKGVARKVRKGYIGIGGVARPFWSSNELAYYGTITSLSAGRRNMGATTVGDYALFGGGYPSPTVVDAYNSSLVRSTATALSTAGSELAATTVGNYALFGGGQTKAGSGNETSRVNAYNTSLTRTTPSGLSAARMRLAAGTIGNYALFGGGNESGTVVDAYNSSLTRSKPTALSASKMYLGATAVGDYLLFGGASTGQGLWVVDTYNKSLTKGTAPSFTADIYAYGATTVGDYALFGGGSTATNIVYAYNSSLTQSLPEGLSVARLFMGATTVGNYALFGGGGDGGSTANNTVDVYDDSLTKTIATTLSVARYGLAATTVGNFALFAGGSVSHSTVDAYTVA